jgi:hypothetical protein
VLKKKIILYYIKSVGKCDWHCCFDWLWSRRVGKHQQSHLCRLVQPNRNIICLCKHVMKIFHILLMPNPLFIIDHNSNVLLEISFYVLCFNNLDSIDTFKRKKKNRLSFIYSCNLMTCNNNNNNNNNNNYY